MAKKFHAQTPAPAPRIIPDELKPTLGRIVHYMEPHTELLRAAIVTEVGPDETVSLHVFAATAHVHNVEFSHSVEPKPGCWSWPIKR